MRFEELYRLRTERKLTTEEAALQLGVHERTFRRWCRHFEEEGSAGLLDQRLDRAAHNSAPVDEVVEVLNLFETHYPNFSAAHFYDKYCDDHKGTRSYSWIKNRLQEAGFVKKAKTKGVHRRKRPRQPMKGMLLHQDASTHEWIEGAHWDLVVTLDDADNEIYSAFFVEEEGTFSSFQGVAETIKKHGLFCSLYTDRGAHYWTTLKAGDRVNKVNLTQFGRAMQQLGIDMIAAYSPEARGRSERMFKTLQGRLPKELKLAGIQTMKEANYFLKKVFLPLFNKRFTIQPEEETRAFIPYNTRLQLQDILCLQETRQVNKDNTVKYKTKHLQIPKQAYRAHFARARVTVHEYMNGSLAIFHGPRLLANYNQKGEIITQKQSTLLTKAA